MVQITRKKLMEFRADEAKASKVYRHYGFKGPSKDEARHKRFMDRQLKKLEKKK